VDTSITSSHPGSVEGNSTTLDEALTLLEELSRRGTTARLLGGLGVALRCPSTRGQSPLARTYSDLDLVTTRSSVSALATVVGACGYEPARRFNAAHGRTRLLFADQNGRHVDIFIGTFTMCHALPLEKRLTIHGQTLSLADLLLTKLQIAQLNRKDIIDAVALMSDHDLSADEGGINVEYIAHLLSDDWGWWRTVATNVATIVERASELELTTDLISRVRQSGQQLLEAIDQRPKTFRWRMRAKVGDRVPWRDEPEEVGAS
jgi:hypothetical protein